MTDKRQKLPVTRPGAGYEVGYGKPPEASRFRPGQSGNPNGRPKGARNKRPGLHEERMKELILEEAYRDITVRDGAANVTIPMVQAVLRSLAVNAAKGQHRAQRLFSELLASVETSRTRLNDRWLKQAIEYKVEWEKEILRRERLGITDLPDPLPHPDHVKIDFDRGTARIVGPSTKEERAALDWYIAHRDGFEADLEGLTAELATTTDPDRRSALEADIAGVEHVLGLIETFAPE